MKRLTFLASTYLAFRQLPHGKAPVYPQIMAARELIRSRYLPNCGQLSDALPFEFYPQALKVRSGSWADFYYPIRT